MNLGAIVEILLVVLIWLLMLAIARTANGQSNNFSLSWTAPTNNAGPILVDQYYVYRATQLTPAIWQHWTNFNSTNALVTNIIALASSTNAFIMVTASNINGESLPSNTLAIGASLGSNSIPANIIKGP